MSTKIKPRPTTIYNVSTKTYITVDVDVREQYDTTVVNCKEKRITKVKVRPLWPSQ